MADALVKISALTTVTGTAAAGGDLIPIVDSSNTKAITLTELTNYLTNHGLGSSVTNNTYVTNLTANGTGSFFEKWYLKSNAAPTSYGGVTHSDYPPGGDWSRTIPSGNQVLWSITGLVLADSSGLVPGAHWTAPVREGTGQVILYVDNTEPGPVYDGNGGPTNDWLQDGDIWYDTKDNNKIYYYDHTQSPKWVGVFTPFPGIDTSGNVTGLQTAKGLKNAFAIVADYFQIVSPTASAVPFEVRTISVGGVPTPQVFIKSEHVGNLDAGVITGGEITAAISITSPTIKAGKVSCTSAVFNPDNVNYTMPAVCYGRFETGTGSKLIDQAVAADNTSGQEIWLNETTFIGWMNGYSSAGRYPLRFGLNSMIFNYAFEGYTNDNLNGENLNVVYRVLDGATGNGGNIVVGTTQVQFPQADVEIREGAPRRLTQHGSVIINGLTGNQVVQFGVRVGAYNGYANIVYGQLTVTGYNI